LRLLCEEDSAALVLAAADGELWNLPFTNVPSAKTIDDYIRTALKGHVAGTMIPFVVQLRGDDRTIGATRFLRLDRKNRKVEIGSTWFGKSWQRTFVNTEAKYLMLRFAFERMNCIRVQLIADESNANSRAAILRLGAKEEGIIRNERIMPDGRKRNSVYCSIIDDEWPSVRLRLEARLAGR